MKNIFCLLVILFFVSCNLAPGSYPYAEIYEFQVSESRLISAVEKFKNENPKYTNNINNISNIDNIPGHKLSASPLLFILLILLLNFIF